MPETKFQKIFFGTLMSLFMVYGMEVYNAALRSGNLFYSSFIIPPDEMILLTAIVFIIQSLIGGPAARKLAFTIVSPDGRNAGLTIFAVSASTVVFMCPMMSFVATALFKGINGNLFIKWMTTMALNFPMAFCWQVFVAGPMVRFIHRKIFMRQSL